MSRGVVLNPRLCAYATATPPGPAELDDEALALRETELRDQITAALADESTDIEALEALATALDEVSAETDRRAEVAAENVARRAAIAARVAAPEDPEPEEAEPEPEPVPTADAPADEQVDAPVLVTASATPAARPRVARPRIVRPPVTASQGATITALPGNGRFDTGASMDADGLVDMLTASLNMASPVTTRVARAEVTFDRSMTLGSNAEANAAILRRGFASTAPQALTATGGSCAPLQPLYDVVNLSTQGLTPVIDALRQFPADRNGFQLVPGPALSDVAAAGDLVSNAEDIAGEVKGVLTFTCAATRSFALDAVTRRNRFGNVLGRANPELVRSWLDESMARHAEIRESRVLGDIRVNSVVATSGGGVGTWREFTARLNEFAAAYRRNPRRRMKWDAKLDVRIPSWVPRAFIADAARNADFIGEVPTFMQIEDAIKGFDLNPIWYVDTPTDEDHVLIGTQMQFGAQVAGVILPFPTVAGISISAPDVFGFATGGTLDFGVVRDTTMNAVNNYEIMLEVFERLLFRGPANSAMWIDMTLCASGQRSGLTTVTCPI